MKSNNTIPIQILDYINSEQIPIGGHLSAQVLADRLRFSRSPITHALALLEQKGLVNHKPNQGYFVAQHIEKPALELAETLGLNSSNAAADLYYRIAEDRLKGRLPDTFSETMLRRQYKITPALLQVTLTRIYQEGWIHKKPGYGWEFSPMLTTPESLMQSYRLRLVVEPAALLEPNYRLSADTVARLRDVEFQLLDGGIEAFTAEQLHTRGVYFHESLVEASGNTFFIDTIKRVNCVRRLIAYRSMQDRQRYKQHCEQHLMILELLEQEQSQKASDFLRTHLLSTMNNICKISSILKQ